MKSLPLYFIFSLFLLYPSSTHALDLYVSPTGNDSNPGTQTQPFQSIPRAQTEVRNLIKLGLSSPTTVFLRSGTYRLSSTLSFTELDSGTSQYPITYTSYPGESAIISGGIGITGWTKTTGPVWQATITTTKPFRDLFLDNIRLTRARFPNYGFMRTIDMNADRTQFILDRPLPTSPNWTLANNAELVTLYSWETSRTPISFKTISNGIVTNVTVGVSGISSGLLSPIIGQQIFIENDISLLDVPGEWYLDIPSHKVYYYPLNGEDPNTKNMTAPILNELISLKGTHNQPITNFHLKNLSIQDSDWSMPATGYDGLQGNYRLLNKTNSYSASPITGAVNLQYLHDSTFFNNNFGHLGAAGITLGVGVKNFTFDHNKVYDVGGNCLHVGWDAGKSMGVEWPLATINGGDVPQLITLSNNEIHNCAQVFYGGYGILASYVPDLTISHNLIHDLPYSGIGITSQWAPGVTSLVRSKIEYNHLYQVTTLLGDGGAIYTLGNNSASTIYNNLIHNFDRSPYATGGENNGIFFDEYSSGYSVANNVIYYTSGAYIRHNYNYPSDHLFGINYLGILPGTSNYPQAIADVVGPLPLPPSPSPSPSSSPSAKLGDATGEGTVDGIDYVVWLSHYKQTLAGGPSVGDFNTSGTVNGEDYVLWLNNYKK